MMGPRPYFLLYILLLATCFLKVQADDEGDKVVISSFTPRVDMIDVAWDVLNPSENITRFMVIWRDAGGTSYECAVDYPNSTTLDCIQRPPLRSCTLYNITINPQYGPITTQKPVGIPASGVNATLVNGAVEITVVRCDSPGNETLWVSWQGPGDCIKYSVQYTGHVLWGEEDEFQDVFTTRFSEVNLPFVVPYTAYNVTVTADDALESGTCTATTPQDVPSEPSALEIIENDENTINVTWGEPVRANGILRSYRFRFLREGEPNYEINTLEHSSLVGNLDPCRWYTVAVAASTDAGFGDEAAENYGVPQAPMVSCHEFINPVTYVPTIIVNWTVPSANCTFESYHIFYKYHVLWSDEHFNDSAVNTGSASYYAIEFPAAYSNYSIEVKAGAAAGMWGAPGYCALQTREAPPGAPQNLGLVYERSNLLKIQWEPPTVLNGVVRGYFVHWQKTGNTFGDHRYFETVEGQLSYTYTIDRLVPSSYYLVNVRAVTVTRGLAAKKTFMTSPVEEVQSDNTLLIVLTSLLGAVSLALLMTIVYIKRNSIKTKFATTRRR